MLRGYCFSVSESSALLAQRIPRVLEHFGYRSLVASDLQFVAERGRRTTLSPRVEDWKCTLRLSLLPTLKGCRVQVNLALRSGFQLAGAMESRLLDAEMALFAEALAAEDLRGIRRLSEVANRLRAAIFRTAFITMLAAAGAVIALGAALHHAVAWIALAAALVALMDGLAILAFADLVLEGAEGLPRLPPEPAAPPERTRRRAAGGMP